MTTALPPLQIDRAFATVPLRLNWSLVGHQFDLGDRSQRAHVDEIILREGRPEDLLAYVDGALLVDLWTDLVRPQQVHVAWQALINASIERGAA